MSLGIFNPGLAGSVPSKMRMSPRTTQTLHLYVSGLNGSDLNTGLAADVPLATLTAAEALIPEIIDNPVFIHIGKHTGTGYEPPEMRPRMLMPNCNVYWWGDGADQPGETGFVIDLSATAIATTNANQVTSGTAMTVNGFRGYTIRMTSGAANGQYRTIRDNTATIITPVIAFTVAPAATDTFEIVHPEVIVKFPNTVTFAGENPLVTGCGAPAGNNFSATATGSVWFINQRWAGGGTSTTVAITDSKVVFFGVLSTETTLIPQLRFYGSQVWAGEEISDVTGTGFSTQAQSDIGMPTGTWLRGVGIAYTAATARMLVTSNSTFRGFFVGAGFTSSQRGLVVLSGGNILGTGGAASPVAAASGAEILFAGTSGTEILVADSISTGCLSASDNSLITVSQTTITNAGGPAVYVSTGAVIEAAASATGTGTTFGVQAQFGGKFYVSGACGLLGAAGSDLSIDSVAGAGLAVATLAASGDSHFNGADGSLIERTA